MTLRTRLVLGMLALATLGLLVADIATYASLRSFLVDQVDQSLQSDHVAVEQGLTSTGSCKELRLDPEVFFRAHKSSLVNLRHVKEIVPWFGGRYKLVMRDGAGSEVALSRAQARELRARLRW